MRISTAVVAMIVVLASGSARAHCPGNVFIGEPLPKGSDSADKWVWTLNAQTGEATIQKQDNSDSRVTGHVDMHCSKDNKWSAHLTNMSHGVKYKCIGKLSEGSVGNGRCTTNVGDKIKLTGRFSPHN